MNKKYPLILVILISAFSYAQSKEELALRDLFWDASDPQKNTIQVPEKWQNESAVILYAENNYDYTNNGKRMLNPTFYHQRVVLQDKAAVESFSEFTYEEDKQVSMPFYRFFEQKTTMGIKIIKPGGEERILDIDSEKVTQDSEIKIAVPGLEIGDIIDVFVHEDNFLRSFTGTHYYEPVERLLSSSYPTVYRKISVELEKDYFLNMQSFNGAPEIVEVPTENKRSRKYVLEAFDIEKSKLPRWYYPLVELPAVKFQVTFALRPKNEKNANVFLAEEDTERKFNVTHDEILSYYGERFRTAKNSELRRVRNYIKEQNITDKREQIVQGLYYMRHNYFNKFIEIMIANDNNISTMFTPCDNDFTFLDEERFVVYMAGLAKVLEIDYDIIVATDEFNGSIDDLLLRSNVSYGLRFNFKDPLYLFHLTPHVQAEYFPPSLEGTKVYKISVVKNRNLEEVTTDFLPTTTAEENKSHQNIKVKIENGFNTFAIDRVSEFSGHFKTEELQRRLFLGDFLDEEFTHYDTYHFYECKGRLSRIGEEVKNKLSALMKRFKEEKDKNLEELVGNEFNAKVENYSYQVLASSRYSNTPLIIQDHFEIKDKFISKAGPNYIIEVGKLIGGQIQVKDDERERTLGIYLDYAKTFSYQIEVSIPEGFEVVGLENLQKNILNTTGGFTSSAKIENNTLIYTTTKTYGKKNYTSDEWALLLPWLDTAYDFSEEKIMFRKI